MKATAEKINPEDYILSVLSSEERLEASFKIAKEAFAGPRHLGGGEVHR